jgi:hypothetical protein
MTGNRNFQQKASHPFIGTWVQNNPASTLPLRRARARPLLADFIDEIYMPWSESNKKSFHNDWHGKVILEKFFGHKQLREI